MALTKMEIAFLKDILSEFKKDSKNYKELKKTGNSQGEHKEFYRGKYEAYNRAYIVLLRYMKWFSIIED